jgi:hypothetical protein
VEPRVSHPGGGSLGKKRRHPCSERRRASLRARCSSLEVAFASFRPRRSSIKATRALLPAGVLDGQAAAVTSVTTTPVSFAARVCKVAWPRFGARFDRPPRRP